MLNVIGEDIAIAAKVKNRLNILIADDNPDDVFFLQESVKRAGANLVVKSARDGIETLAYLNGEGPFQDRSAYPFPDILILDLNMPGLNGFEVLDSIRQNPRYSCLVVHVMSASSREIDIKKAYDLRANSYVVKPSRIDELVRFVSALHLWHSFTLLPPI